MNNSKHCETLLNLLLAVQLLLFVTLNKSMEVGWRTAGLDSVTYRVAVQLNRKLRCSAQVCPCTLAPSKQAALW